MNILEKLGLTGLWPKSPSSRLIIVSNRLPVSVETRRDGYELIPSAGGLATGLGSIYKSFNSLWIGWPGLVSEKAEKHKRGIEKSLKYDHSCCPVWISREDVENYYHGFSNKTIWPLFHYFPKLTTYENHHWDSYQKVNELFCEATLKNVSNGDLIWIQDYHLMLLPEMIRKRMPNASIGFFLHIPFPTFEVFRLLPWRDRILQGLLGADLVGFHTYDYTLYFLRAVHRLLGHGSHMGLISLPSRTVKADTFPIGIDYEKFSRAVADASVATEVANFRKSLGDKKIILSIDRLDYTKGITQRLEALDIFFSKYPAWRGKVTNVIIAAPSRDQVDHYRRLKREVDELIGKINGKYGTISWAPIKYIYRTMSFQSVTALYAIADIALITPVRDGMNLVAKEYVASKNDLNGVLILSEMTGAASELSEALIVNPNDIGNMAEAIAKALEMPQNEKMERMSAMRRRVERYNAAKWGEDFIMKLQSVKKEQGELAAKLLSKAARSALIDGYSSSISRLFLIDYDGTLVGFFPNPADAKPGAEIKAMLKKLASDDRNKVVIISGRGRDTLDDWFSETGVEIVSEHGTAFKEDGEWRLTDMLSAAWMEEIRPILEFYADRTPGAFVEEKEYSLVWHYRKADPELGAARANELKDNLKAFTVNLGLQIQEGSKVVDIRNAGINKGRAATHYLGKKDWGFILSIGDDWTDEDMFKALPANAISIRVGLHPTSAKYNVETPDNVISMLNEMSTLE